MTLRESASGLKPSCWWNEVSVGSCDGGAQVPHNVPRSVLRRLQACCVPFTGASRGFGERKLDGPPSGFFFPFPFGLPVLSLRATWDSLISLGGKGGA